MGGLAGSSRQVQADMRTHLIHRPARDTIPPLVELEFPLCDWFYVALKPLQLP
jgi:hypothetical protein